MAGIRDAGPLDVAAKIAAPILGLYGEADQGIPAADVKEMEAAQRNFRGSASRPSMALAATVAGLARKMRASREPMRPW